MAFKQPQRAAQSDGQLRQGANGLLEPDAFESADENTQTGRINVAHLLQVDHEIVMTLVDQLERDPMDCAELLDWQEQQA